MSCSFLDKGLICIQSFDLQSPFHRSYRSEKGNTCLLNIIVHLVIFPILGSFFSTCESLIVNLYNIPSFSLCILSKILTAGATHLASYRINNPAYPYNSYNHVTTGHISSCQIILSSLHSLFLINCSHHLSMDCDVYFIDGL